MENYRIIVAGDLLPWDNNFNLFESGDAKTLFGDELYRLFQKADFSIVNLEGPLTDSIIKQNKIGPVIKAGKKTIRGIKALGVKAVAMANNHVTDYMQQGIIDTFMTLDENGIQYVGAGLDSQHISTHLSIEGGGKRICIYNVSETFFNAPTSTSAGVNLYDEYRVCNELRDLKKEHDYIIVIYHGGAEYFPYPTPQTRQRFHRMVDSGADLITAQHTHCIGCEEYYDGAYLLYGQGNFLFAKQTIKPMTKEGFVLELVFGDSIEIIKHHVELTANACLQLTDYKQQQEFVERSEHIFNDDYIIQQFERLKPDNIIDSYLLAFKGRAFVLDKFKRFITNKMWRKAIESYTPKQIMRNQFVLNSDRAREDVYYMWHHISKKRNG